MSTTSTSSPINNRSHHAGMTWLEWCVAMVIMLVLVCVPMPMILAARESARRMSCGNNFKQIGLGFLNYHAAYNRLPGGCGGTGPTPANDDWSNQRRLSAMIPISPFVVQSPLWEYISCPYITGDVPTPDITDPQQQYSKSNTRLYRDSLDGLSTADGPLVNESGDHYFPAMGPAPWRASVYPMWQEGLYGLRCPSDPVERPTKQAALSNYAFCYGDAVHEVGYPRGEFLEFRQSDADKFSQRGAFMNGEFLAFSDFKDGLANTVLMAEVATFDGSRRAIGSVAAGIKGLRDRPANCLDTVTPTSRSQTRSHKSDINLRLTSDGKASRGGNWADGAITWSGFNTILPPNSPSCDTEDEQRLEGVFSAASLHRDGCHVLMADGAIKFISDTIDSGNTNTPSVYTGSAAPAKSPSPYGVWGAMGTRASESKE